MDQIKIPSEIKPPLHKYKKVASLQINDSSDEFECPYVMIEGLPYPFPFHYFEFKLDVQIENSIEKEQQGF